MSAGWKHTVKVIDKMTSETDIDWCMALHGNHDEHQCHKTPGHREKVNKLEERYPWRHECYCGVWW